MIKTSWKKSLVVAGVLTALCASAAFAAEQPAQKPSMRERTNAILHHDENSASPDRPYHMERGRHWGGPMHPGPQLTDEQVKEREARRAEWEQMTPEQRQEAHAKWREERMKNMTPEEKERFEQREAKREEWRQMTPEQRQKAREEARAKWDSMSESEKEAAREHFRTYYHGGGHYYEGHRKYRHHKGENRGDYYRDGYHNRGEYRGDCPNTNCPW
ncbi:hypothetical protein [Phascolarctobacterium faecium]|uniref:hypothetical protein n=1 Tax=Phascolarctobacterium faecium TaxID=33025 RepID=UPI002664EE36|nr:hypothetical protein [Phascolarctobacterium faecium]